MSTFKIERVNISSNVARARNEIKLTISADTLTGNIVDGVIELPNNACEAGLIFTCQDNSQYLPLI
jgi:hypothetical protein